MNKVQKQFYIILGKSGSGKGTQASKLKDYLLANGHSSVCHVTTGGALREFVSNSKSLSSKLMGSIMIEGRSLPDFIAIWNWNNIFINSINGEETIILDGAPRKGVEAKILDEAIDYYGYDNVIVVYIDVTDAWAIQRLVGRGREDDSDIDKVKNKMEWFATDVLEVIDWYKNYNTKVKWIHVNGEKSIDEVFNSIIEILK